MIRAELELRDVSSSVEEMSGFRTQMELLRLLSSKPIRHIWHINKC